MTQLNSSPAFAELADDPALAETELAASLSALVAVPSVNPGIGEQAMAEAVLAQLGTTGFTFDVVEFAPGRPSVAATLEGSEREPRLVVNGHMDTVAIGDADRWTAGPFSGEVRDGAVWGRGAVDMKGGLAAQIGCARALARRRAQLRGSLVMHFAAGEECGEPGTVALIERGHTGTWGIVTEPTALKVATAMRGVCWFRIRIDGRSTHGGTAQAGLNPAQPMGALLTRLERYTAALHERRHPLVERATCSVTMVRAGVQHNAIPDSAEIVVDRRLLPGETPEQVARELEALADEAGCRSGGFSCRIEPLHHAFVPAEVPSDSPFVSTVRTAAELITGGPAEIIGTPYGCDVRNLVHEAGMEAITFGPGDPAACHCIDEHLATSELAKAALVLAKVAMDLLT
jgi:succinyl-diaminopimelate desuccinylase